MALFLALLEVCNDNYFLYMKKSLRNKIIIGNLFIVRTGDNIIIGFQKFAIMKFWIKNDEILLFNQSFFF